MCPGNVDIGMYRGTVNVTNGGRACQNWASVTPHRHSFKDEMFLVGTWGKLFNASLA